MKKIIVTAFLLSSVGVMLSMDNKYIGTSEQIRQDKIPLEQKTLSDFQLPHSSSKAAEKRYLAYLGVTVSCNQRKKQSQQQSETQQKTERQLP